MLGMKHAALHVRRQGSGRIINNGSIAGRLAGFSSPVVYGAAKAAVIHLTNAWRWNSASPASWSTASRRARSPPRS
jgi:NAD(P)-dependent dehydrogenase (short-subunit alcohol dehydrogenase family)